MIAEISDKPLFILMTGFVLLGVLFLRALEKRISFPAIVGYLMLGLLIRWQNDSHGFLNHEGVWTLEMFGEIGVVCLLFRVGLESNFQGLIEQLPNAIWVWVSNVAFSAALGFIASRYWLGMDLIPSLFVATALSATSIGVSMSVWQEARKLKTKLGELVTDTAELDDISTVMLLVILFSLVPILEKGGSLQEIEAGALQAMAGLFVRGVIFALICIFFANYLEKPVSRFFNRHSHPVIFLLGSGFVIGALAGWLGFSMAIGGLFAGLIFSRDPQAVKEDTSYEPIYELFTPFFFIAIGFQINPLVLEHASTSVFVLFFVAIIGKMVGALLPTVHRLGWQAACILGISLVPRAEIAMVVAKAGNSGPNAVISDELFASMVLVCLATCLLTPPLLQVLLNKEPSSTQ